MRRSKFPVRFRRGITLIEIAMVLAIGAIVIAGVMLFFQSASTSADQNKATSQVASAITTVKKLYNSAPTYAGLTNTVVFSSLPRDMQDVSPNLINAFGGSMTFGTAASNTQATVQFTDVPLAACPQVASTDLGSDIVDIQVGPQAAPATAAGSTTTVMVGGRPDVATANGECTAEYNTVRWHFR